MSSPLIQNIQWTLEQATAFIAEAKQKPNKNRSRYYKASFIFISAAVEALVFIIVKNFCVENQINHRSEFKYIEIYLFPNELLKNRNSVVGIYEKKPEKFKWKDNISWQSTNEIGYKYGIFDKRLFNKLDSIRIKRNKIHIHSLQIKDHKYTKKDIEYASSVILKLIDKLSNLNQ